jgi:hypothetical protein
MSDDKLMTTMMMIGASASFGFGVSSFGLQKVQRSSARLAHCAWNDKGFSWGKASVWVYKNLVRYNGVFPEAFMAGYRRAFSSMGRPEMPLKNGPL